MIHIFIINSKVGPKDSSVRIREELSKMKDLKYYIFTTRGPGHEPEIVRTVTKIFAGEKIRFYACGGSGTMQQMLRGFDDLSEAEVAMYPLGTNDFLKVFSNKEDFYDLEKLVNGEVLMVDYIKTNHGAALNTFSFGMDSEVASGTHSSTGLAAFGENFPMIWGLLYGIFASANHSYEVLLDDGMVRGKSMEVIFGNGNTLGGILKYTEKADIRDGVATYLIGKNRVSLMRIPSLLALTGKDNSKVDKVTKRGESTRMKVRRADGGLIYGNLDGELVSDYEWHAEIVPKGLRFVVPKGVANELSK